MLVLGGTGFAGSEITKALLQRGLDVVAVSRRASSASLKVRCASGCAFARPCAEHDSACQRTLSAFGHGNCGDDGAGACAHCVRTDLVAECDDSAAMHEVDAARVELVSADLVKRPNAVGEILTERGPFVGVVHCIGMLLPNQLNALASGSGSVPDEGVDPPC